MTHGKKELQALIVLFCSTLYTGDPDTLAHCRRVARYAELIARDMGLPPAVRQRIFRAALLHDIGKIGIRKTILNKPGKLTAWEARQMAEHPRISYDILCRYRSFSDILTIVLHHHERYDGAGYPAGLKGLAIPLDARIITVADTLDAMTSKRPYRAKITLRLAAREMMPLANRQFDPRILGHLSRILPHLESGDTALTVNTPALLPNVLHTLSTPSSATAA